MDQNMQTQPEDKKEKENNQLEQTYQRQQIKLPYDPLIELCYNSGDSPIYGEITNTSIIKIMRYVTESLPPELYKTPIHILDIGCGSTLALCKIATLLMPYPCQLRGIEIAPERIIIGNKIIEKHKPTNVLHYEIIESDVCLLHSLPQSHISYSFDKAMDPNTMKHIESLQAQSYSLQVIITSKPKVYQNRPDRWLFIADVNAKMHGSGSSVKFYIFNRIRKVTKHKTITLP